MNDPYRILNLPADADDGAIRERYLELVRRWPPDHAPEKFAEVRQAYEQLRDRIGRLKYRLFERHPGQGLESLIEEAQARIRRRVALKELLAVCRGD